MPCVEIFFVCGLDTAGSPSAAGGFDLPGKVLVVEVCFMHGLTFFRLSGVEDGVEFVSQGDGTERGGGSDT